jgi:hypothetical protein
MVRSALNGPLPANDHTAEDRSCIDLSRYGI